MRIVGFPLDVSNVHDERIIKGQSVRRSLIQATLDLVQTGDAEPSAGAVAMIAGLSSRTLFQHFPNLSDLYAAAFELAVSRAFSADRPVDPAAPLASRITWLVAHRAQLFEEWLPLWSFAERVRCMAPAIGAGVARLRELLRQRLTVWFAAELESLDPEARLAGLDSLDRAFGFDSWMNLRERQRLSPMRASRTWRFTAETIVQQALAGSPRASTAP
ncbi:TetR/AcrR family transcriptional regulator [Reyranella sp.]|uniref:TetR/AcrR family transcriptional regulator n=1 Tax=Reyranella sp. TaxID=1929291 RepID=UPI003BAA4B79